MKTSVASRIDIDRTLIDDHSIISQIEKECLSSGIDILTVHDMVSFINRAVEEYSEILRVSPAEVLLSLEDLRQSSRAEVFYSDKTIPELNGVISFNTRQELADAIPSGKFICPACKSTVNSPYLCTSIISSELNPEGKACGRRNDGLYRSLHNGVRIIILSEFLSDLSVINIFMPVELVNYPAHYFCDDF